MNGTFAAIMMVLGLWDMSVNYCQTGCFQEREVAGYTTYAIGETSFNDDPVGTEVYVRRDTKVAHGPFQNVYGLSISDTGDVWAGIGHAYTIGILIERVDVQLHAMTGLYSRGTGVDLGGLLNSARGSRWPITSKMGCVWGLDGITDLTLKSIRETLALKWCICACQFH